MKLVTVRQRASWIWLFLRAGNVEPIVQSRETPFLTLPPRFVRLQEYTIRQMRSQLSNSVDMKTTAAWSCRSHHMFFALVTSPICVSWSVHGGLKSLYHHLQARFHFSDAGAARLGHTRQVDRAVIRTMVISAPKVYIPPHIHFIAELCELT